MPSHAPIMRFLDFHFISWIDPYLPTLESSSQPHSQRPLDIFHAAAVELDIQSDQSDIAFAM